LHDRGSGSQIPVLVSREVAVFKNFIDGQSGSVVLLIESSAQTYLRAMTKSSTRVKASRS